MHNQFSLKILTQDSLVYEGPVLSLVVPATYGYLGVLANHAPLITNLKQGRIIIKDASGRQMIVNNISKGFLEVLKNKAVILLDSVD